MNCLSCNWQLATLSASGWAWLKKVSESVSGRGLHLNLNFAGQLGEQRLGSERRSRKAYGLWMVQEGEPESMPRWCSLSPAVLNLSVRPSVRQTVGEFKCAAIHGRGGHSGAVCRSTSLTLSLSHQLRSWCKLSSVDQACVHLSGLHGLIYWSLRE